MQIANLETLHQEVMDAGIEPRSLALWSVDEHGFQCLQVEGQKSASDVIDIVRRTYMGSGPYRKDTRICIQLKQSLRFSLLCVLDSSQPLSDQQYSYFESACREFSGNWGLPSTIMKSQSTTRARQVNDLLHHIATMPGILDDKESAETFAKGLHELTQCKNLILARLSTDKKLLHSVYYSDEYDSPMFPMDVESSFVAGSVSAFVAKFGKSIRGNSHDIVEGLGIQPDNAFGHHSSDVIGVPIKYDEEVYGVILIQSYQENFEFEDYIATVLHLIANAVGSRAHEQQIQSYLNTVIEEQTKELKAKNERLTKTIDELSEVRADLIDTQAKASLAKVVLKVAHFLNTPLGNSKLALSLMKEAHDHALKFVESGDRRAFEDQMNQLSQAIELSTSNIVQASNIVREFRKLSAEQDSFVESEFTTNELLSLARESSFELMSNCRIHFHLYGSDQRICSFFSVIADILLYLIDNSIKHGFANKEHGDITIRTQVSPTSLSIWYSDNGRGVEDSHRKVLFDLFQSSMEFSAGLGLGLAVVDSMVKNVLGGQISLLDKDKCKGLGFHISIPLPIHSSSTKSRQPGSDIPDGS